jgi:hypothetical protein
MARRARGRPPSGAVYFHVVFTLPAAIADIAYQNKAAIYDILFTTSAETMTTIAAAPNISAPASASPRCFTPGVHTIVPGGGISVDGTRWVWCRPDFILLRPGWSIGHLERRTVLRARSAVIVDAGGGDVGVAEPFLNLGDVGLMIERVGGGRGA